MIITAGLTKIGVVVALLNTSQAGEDLDYSLSLVKAKAVVIGSELREVLQKSNFIENLDHVFEVGNHDVFRETKKGAFLFEDLAYLVRQSPVHSVVPKRPIEGKDGCFYVFTSGTTGRPKASVFTHARWMRSYAGFGWAQSYRMTNKDCMYVTLPFYHATAMVICWGVVLANGASLAIGMKFSASSFWQECARYRATSIGYVGELCRYLLARPPGRSDVEHTVVHMIGNGLRPDIWEPFQKRFGVRYVSELYASGEGNVYFSNVLNFPRTVGISVTPYTIVEIDPETELPARGDDGLMRPVTKGRVGLALGPISKRTPFDGYTDSEKTKDSILMDVKKKGDRYFNTGDLMRDLGYRHAQFVDRLGDSFRWKGENVAAVTVESQLNHIDGISAAVAYGVKISNYDGRAGMATIVVNDPDFDLESPIILEKLKAKLPNYAVPVFLRRRANIEATGTFKYNKVSLKRQGFRPSSGEQVYVALPKKSCYQLLTEEVYRDIQVGTYLF
tara:strand:+ start:1 stop:1509 length:1509 start_codon:yes stop_codon:yes gene_type:complete